MHPLLKRHDQQRKCRSRCPGGNDCCCNSVPHHYHICRYADCKCHSRERYETGRVAPSLKPARHYNNGGTLDIWELVRRVRAR